MCKAGTTCMVVDIFRVASLTLPSRAATRHDATLARNDLLAQCKAGIEPEIASLSLKWLASTFQGAIRGVNRWVSEFQPLEGYSLTLAGPYLFDRP